MALRHIKETKKNSITVGFLFDVNKKRFKLSERQWRHWI